MATKKRLMSLLLATIMAIGLIVPAAAATNTVTVTIDGASEWPQSYSGKMTLLELGEKEIASVSVESDGDTDVFDSENYKTAAGTLENGTGYRFSVSEDSNGIQSLGFEITTSMVANVSVDVTTKETTYTINANSGPYGSNNNQGMAGNYTCTVSNDTQTVTGGNSWDIKFTPNNGLEITHLNIRPDYSNNTLGKVVEAISGTVTIAGRQYVITKADDGTVTLHCDKAARNIYVSALTQAEKKTYSLTLQTDGNCTCDASDTTISEGATKTITFTPTISGYNVGDITITDNNITKTIKYNETSATINGKTYSVSRNLDGSVKLSIPTANADIKVAASTTDTTHYVYVDSGTHTTSNQDGTQFFDVRDSYAVTFDPKNNVIIDEIVVRTSRGTYSAHAYDAYIIIEGTYYRLYSEYDGAITMYLTQVPTNMEISVKATDTVHDVTLKTDNGCDTTRTSYEVDDGDDLTVVFEPTKSRYTIDEIKVVYDGTTYRADPQDDSYIRVDGIRWPISVDANGNVTLSMKSIRYDTTVTANTDYTSHGNYRITKSTDSHSNISYTGTSPFDYDSATTIRVTTDKNYIISSIKFTMNGKSETITPFDRSFKLDGITYDVTWEDNTEAAIDFDGFTGSLTVTAKSERGEVEEPEYQTNVYHTAYMIGFGNGYFGPENVLSRAEAVTLLVRAISSPSQSTLNTFQGNGVFYDVRANEWYTSYINYAYSMGYLDVLLNGNQFRPTDPITRAEFLALLCDFNGVDVSDAKYNNTYSDVPSSYWAAKYIAYAHEEGWVNGVGGGYFQPNRSISRVETCTMMNHILGRSADRSKTYGMQFIDVPYTHWAYFEVAEAANTHFVLSYDSQGENWR